MTKDSDNPDPWDFPPELDTLMDNAIRLCKRTLKHTKMFVSRTKDELRELANMNQSAASVLNRVYDPEDASNGPFGVIMSELGNGEWDLESEPYPGENFEALSAWVLEDIPRTAASLLEKLYYHFDEYDRLCRTLQDHLDEASDWHARPDALADLRKMVKDYGHGWTMPDPNVQDWDHGEDEH